MRQMPLGIKFFAGSQVPSTRKMDEKTRFGELFTEEIQEIVDKAVSVTTKEATKFGMRFFNGYGYQILKSLKFP